MLIDKLKQTRADIKAILKKSFPNEQDSYLELLSGKIQDPFIELLISEKKKSMRTGFVLAFVLAGVIALIWASVHH